jgi:APA family basic amino acid/polyamine antiporter
MPFKGFATSSEPLAVILRNLGQGQLALLIGAAAIIALPTVLLAFLYGQSRIFFVMARDGLLPKTLATVSSRGTPVRITLITAVLVSMLAGIASLDEIAALANAGTLIAFMAAGVCVLVLRVRLPARTRIFRTPFAWIVAPVAVAGCAYLFYNLPAMTIIWFFAWNVAGMLIYFTFRGRKKI